MGLFSRISDNYFITKCGMHVDSVLKAQPPIGIEFCDHVQEHLLEMKHRGASAELAVNTVCLLLIDMADDYIATDLLDLSRMQTLVIASNYCASHLERWPQSEYASVMRSAVSTFANYAKGLNNYYQSRG